MTIDPNEIAFYDDEIDIKKEIIFLEKSEKPSSEHGDKIPHGILLLTNKRLFFYCMGTGEIKSKAFRGIEIAKALSNLIPNIPDLPKIIDGASEMVKKGVEKYYHYNNNIDLGLSSNHHDSFVVSLNQIVKCQKFGNYYTPHFGFSKFSLKNKYVRMSIVNKLGQDAQYYSIYCANPRNPADSHFDLRYDKWYNEIQKLVL